MRILIVDDEPILLLALQRSFRLEQPEWEVMLSRSGLEALEQLRLQPFDVLVTDIRMPGMDGMALLAEVRADPLLTDTTVIFMTGLDDRESMRAGMIAGADDYLTKPFTPSELLAAIGGRLRRKEMVPLLSHEARLSREQLAGLLTERETEVLIHIGRGLVTKEIAGALGISPRTVDVHRTNLMRKLDLHNATALARLAIKAHLV
ncbi:response regulator transcription factor [Mesoterricola silvestris]|uniref:DNA-binding response regulator n=1 Tax=Mesoterricola silvestris TaxID=2927979 RepID=A0AA48GU27_9BACT|nr:response regulator transcription factor [Mesoterricola silvestris]BDU74072.1 DNA-binding response regulator [Mesoterricola silvestris]